jgi:methyl-accepting chemotaxis protein
MAIGQERATNISSHPGRGSNGALREETGQVIGTRWLITAETAVIVLSICAAWLSISQKVDNLGGAFSIGQQTNFALLEQTRAIAEGYKMQVEKAQAISEQNKSLADQNLNLVKQIKDYAEKTEALVQQDLELSKKSDAALQAHTATLAEQTRSLKEAQAKASRAEHAAETSQALTRKAVRAIQHPTPKPWFHIP